MTNPNAKILIADENPMQRQSLKEGLKNAGYRNVDDATDGEDALVKINRYHPDVVLVDLCLSKLDGIGVLRNSKQINFNGDTPPSYIIFSVFANPNTFIEAANAGA